MGPLVPIAIANGNPFDPRQSFVGQAMAERQNPNAKASTIGDMPPQIFGKGADQIDTSSLLTTAESLPTGIIGGAFTGVDFLIRRGIVNALKAMDAIGSARPTGGESIGEWITGEAPWYLGKQWEKGRAEQLPGYKRPKPHNAATPLQAALDKAGKPVVPTNSSDIPFPAAFNQTASAVYAPSPAGLDVANKSVSPSLTEIEKVRSDIGHLQITPQRQALYDYEKKLRDQGTTGDALKNAIRHKLGVYNT